jgi:hypothetical protein
VNEFLGVVRDHDLQAADLSAQTIDRKKTSGEKLTEAEMQSKPAFDALVAIKARRDQVEADKWREINNREVLGMRSITVRRLAVFGGSGAFVTSVVGLIASIYAWTEPTDEREYVH